MKGAKDAGSMLEMTAVTVGEVMEFVALTCARANATFIMLLASVNVVMTLAIMTLPILTIVRYVSILPRESLPFGTVGSDVSPYSTVVTGL